MKRVIRFMTERTLSAGDSEEGSPIGWLFVVVGVERARTSPAANVRHP